MSYSNELVSLSPEISLESPASLITATLAPLRDQKVVDEKISEYTLINQRLKAIQEILWVNPRDERIKQLVISAIQTSLNTRSQWYRPDSSAHSLGELHNQIKTTRPDLDHLIEEAMKSLERVRRADTKRKIATTIALHFHPEAIPQAISEQVTGLIAFLLENETMLLTNPSFLDHHASRVQELSWLTQVGGKADRSAISEYLTGFFERHPFGQLNPMTAVDCIKVYALCSQAEKPNPALIAELLATVKAEVRDFLSSRITQPEEMEALIGSIDGYFSDNHDRFKPKTWTAFMKTADVNPESPAEDAQLFNSIIFRHELALKELHALLMDYGQFDEAVALLPQFLASENALVAVHNSQGDALVQNDPGLFNRLLAVYFKAYGRKKYDARDSFYRKFDDHFPYVCAVGTAIRYGRLAELRLSDEIRSAVRFSSHDLCERIETFLAMPTESEWYAFGKELLTELLEEYKEPMSSIDGEDKMAEALRVLLYYRTHQDPTVK